MKLIEHLEGHYLVALGSVVLKVNTSDPQGEVQVIRTDKSGDSHVVTLTVSRETGHLFVGYSNKVVCSFSLSNFELVGSIVLRKQPTAIQYSSFSATAVDRTADANKVHHVLLASDKAGEVFAIDAPLLQKQVLLSGHTASVITDLAIHRSATAHYVATADRDEKVRISHFPDMENIHTFFLGHTKVVASVCFLELDGKVLALSTGWDHKLNLWDAHTGALVQSLSFLTEAEKTEATTEQKEAEAEEGVEVDAAEAAEAGEGEPVAETAEGEEEDLEGKVYDEISAGNYPMKVVVNQGLHREREVLVNVLFKGLAVMKVLRVAVSNGTFLLSEVATVSLSAVPVDVQFVSANDVSVLLPRPHGLQVHRVTGAAVVDVTASVAPLAKLTATAESLGESTLFYYMCMCCFSSEHICILFAFSGLDFALPDGSSDTHNATGKQQLFNGC